MKAKETVFMHRGYVYIPKYKITDDGEIYFVHNISKKREPSNVVFLYSGCRLRPLHEDEFKNYVDRMIRVTESGY
jgi:hypothetical protein|tara:strand:+ start:257 stop:481 length:225 start_codon:yes stop_codon:yes gene_type:complete